MNLAKLWKPAGLALAGMALAAGGYAVGKRCGSHQCPPGHHEGEHAAAPAGLPSGHPDIGSGQVQAPPLTDAALAKGKTADCPYMAKAVPGKNSKDRARQAAQADARDLAQYVLGTQAGSGTSKSPAGTKNASDASGGSK